jgi:hypothetical protein
MYATAYLARAVRCASKMFMKWTTGYKNWLELVSVASAKQ